MQLALHFASKVCVCVKTLVTGHGLNNHSLPSCKITILSLPYDMPLQA